MPPARWLVPVCLLTVYIVWGTTYFAIRVAVESLPPFATGGVRIGLAGVVLLAVARLRGEAWPTPRQWGDVLPVSFLLFVGGNGGVMWASREVDSGLVAIVVATMTLWAALLGRLYGQPTTLRQWGGIALGLLGVAALNFDADLAGHPLALGVLLLSAFSWALGTLEARRRPPPAPLMASGSQMLVGGLWLLGAAILVGESWPDAPTVRSLVAVAYLLVFGSIVAFTAYGLLVRYAPLPVATSYVYVNPLIAVFVGWLLGGERLDPPAVVGLGLVLAAVALVTLRAGSNRR